MAIHDLFENLEADEYRETSPRNPDYNCIAWAAGDDSKWWDALPGYYWPDGTKRSFSVDGLIKAYAAHGFVSCNDASMEAGFEKIAIYGDRRGYQHAARQLPNGKWTSKLGKLQDIEHNLAESLEGDEYGEIRQIMKRKRP